MIRWLAFALTACAVPTPTPTLVPVGSSTLSLTLNPVGPPTKSPTHAPVTKSPTHAPVTKSPTHAPVVSVPCGAGTVPSIGDCFVGHTVSTDRVYEYGGSCYLFGDDDGGLTWKQARDRCESVESHLVTIDDKAEDIFIAERALALGWERERYWIGLKEHGNYTWYWEDSRTCSWYRNFKRGKMQDESKPKKRCVQVDARKFNWYPQTKCRDTLRYVCEGQVTVGTQGACVECAKGKYSYERSNGNVACASCPWGRFNSHTGQAQCDSCPTFSPAHLLATKYNGGIDEVRVEHGGSVRCSGGLGSSQKQAYVMLAVMLPFMFILMTCCAPFLAIFFCCLICAPDDTIFKDRMYLCRWGLLFISPWIIGGSLLAHWLSPLDGVTGRLTATSMQRACDPGNRHGYLISGIFFAALPVALPVAMPFLFLLYLLCDLLYLCLVRCAGAKARHRRDAQEERDRVRAEEERRLLLGQLKKNLEGWEADAREAHDALAAERTESLLLPRALLCTLCRARRASALNMPCNHLFFCEDCAHEFRAEVGNVCNGCREPSTITLVVRKGQVVQDIATYPKVRMVEQAMIDGSSAERLQELITRTRDWKTNAKAIVLNKICAVCADRSKPLVIDVPCGHATLCESCALDTRAKRGENCYHCAMPSTVRLATSEQHCSVCLDEVNGAYLAAVGVCGHQLCTACSVEYVRAALDNVSENVHSDGLRCPLHYSGCKSKMSSVNMRRLIQRQVRPDVRSDTLPLTAPELDRLDRFMDEASFDKDEIFACCHRECARLFAVPNRDQLKQGLQNNSADSIRKRARDVSAAATRRVNKKATAAAAFMRGMIAGRTPELEDVELTELEAAEEIETPLVESPSPPVTCPWCSKQSCVRCSTPAHGIELCSEIQKDPTLIQTNLLIEATTKNCPKCKFGVTHYHGHDCHHIVPGSGCKNCGTHFCYTCLKEGTSGRACGCKLFCAVDNIKTNLKKFPFPHDERCTCPICPECRPSRPCALCPGSCVVCRGLVRPGPLSLAQVENWQP